ncbi:MAG: NADH-ubiquinone oxidoreductase-F iron-sulfur binding region domain-containing protein [Jatrophihabitans sp.]
MTALLHRAGPNSEPDTTAWAIGAPRLLAGLERVQRLNLPGHHAVHGPIPGADRDHLLAQLDAAGISGRGGAGFSLAAKVRALAEGRAHVVVNGTESEPASLKDRVLLLRSAHLVLDGALAVAAAVRARDVTVAVHDEFVAASVRAAVSERGDARRVAVVVIAGGFVSGEARAVVRALRGGPALPPGRRTPPTADGVLLANAETFAQVAVLLRLGPHRFGETGTGREPGTTLITVGGAVGRPGVVEIPFGTPLGIVLAAVGSAEPQAVVLGGYHGGWHAPIPQIRLSRDGLAAAGGTFGAGVVLVVGRDTCALGELARVAGWLAAESAGQCGPCVFGLPALARDASALAAGHRTAVAAALGHARVVDGRGACAHPDGAARFVTSAVHLLRDETDRHRAVGTCGRPVLGHLPLRLGR